ncbi:MAG: hypothetical protein FWB99_07335 [Treponema sp.]|nr:hypothetical protein [Treponema sp.]
MSETAYFRVSETACFRVLETAYFREKVGFVDTTGYHFNVAIVGGLIP